MLEKVKEIVAEGLDVNAADLTEETTFESLGADSLDLMDMVMTFEDEFKSFRWLHPLHLQEEWNGAGQMQLLRKDVNPEDTSEKIRLWYWFHRL